MHKITDIVLLEEQSKLFDIYSLRAQRAFHDASNTCISGYSFHVWGPAVFLKSFFSSFIVFIISSFRMGKKMKFSLFHHILALYLSSFLFLSADVPIIGVRDFNRGYPSSCSIAFSHKGFILLSLLRSLLWINRAFISGVEMQPSLSHFTNTRFTVSSYFSFLLFPFSLRLLHPLNYNRWEAV